MIKILVTVKMISYVMVEREREILLYFSGPALKGQMNKQKKRGPHLSTYVCIVSTLYP